MTLRGGADSIDLLSPGADLARVVADALAPGGIFILEKIPGQKLPLGARWELLRERRYAPHPDPRLPCARDRRLMRRALCARRGPLTRLRVLLALAPGMRIARRREASAGAAPR